MFDRHDRSRAASVRLTALVALLAGAWTLACRPAWSPDGKHVVYPAKVGEHLALARHELGTGEAEVLFTPPGEPSPLAVAWREDPGEWVALSRTKDEQKTLVVTCLSPTGDVRTTHRVPLAKDAMDLMIAPPVVVGSGLFLGGEAPARLDLDSGALTRGPDGPDGAEFVLTRRGEGVCYVTQKGDVTPRPWEIGALDPKTLARERLVAMPDDAAWRILALPSFSPKLDRLAVVAQREVEGEQGPEDEAAVLVFRGGELETTLSLGRGDIDAGPPVWSPDGVTIFGVVSRSDAGRATVQLHETSFSGSYERATTLLKHDEVAAPDVPRTRTSGLMSLCLQPALSPDGRWLAMTTAYLDKLSADRSGLLLVDLKHDEREVTLVPFPKKAR